ncbi:hypothetical protein C8J57DRAFT_1476047 [Mycena rebaudengoi]|nr:hypothetical protein C8J57DRAFT_1476047 [Mycena rebaudengoi]
MSDAPNAKRRRTENIDATETSEQPIIRSTDHWFDDGNIILQIQSTQFRLYKGILSLHSSVFRDMFSIPLPPDEPMIEGCPMVTLSGDTVQDWTHLLSVMHPKQVVLSSSICLSTSVPRVALVAAMLRLGKKYDFAVFRKDALRRLRVELPTELFSWGTWKEIQLEDDMEFAILSVVREVGLYSILPLLLYILVSDRYYMNKIIYDSNVEIAPDDRLTCLQGHFKLINRQAETTMCWLNPSTMPSSECSSPAKCMGGMRDLLALLHEERPLDILAVGDWDDDWDTHMCPECRQVAQDRFNNGREQCWKELPSIFGLPDWSELASLDFE